MYKKLTNLPIENLQKLQELSRIVIYKNKIEHLGVHGYQRLSIYTNSKWYDWTRQQKQEFKSCFETDYVNKAIIGWFINYPKEVGFLDRTEYWKTTNSAGIVLAYALTDGLDIHLNDTRVTVNQGEGIAFSLRIPHEIKAKTVDQRWACLMTMSMP